MRIEGSQLLLALLLTILVVSQFVYGSSTLTVTVMTDKETYNLGEDVNINGTLTVPDWLVAIQVSYPPPYGICVIRTRPTGHSLPNNWTVEILQLYPSDEGGNPKDSFKRGTNAHFTIEWRNNDTVSRYIAIFVNLYYANNAPFKAYSPAAGLLDPGESRGPMVFSVPIPSNAPIGTATIYASALSGEPKDEGFAYCPEKSHSFIITATSSATVMTATTESQTVNPASAEGTYNLTFHLPHTGGKIGNYTVNVSAVYEGQQATDSRTFEVILLGDVNDDGKVELADLMLVIKYYGTTPSSPDWYPDADVNGDGKVELADLMLVIKHYGESIF